MLEVVDVPPERYVALGREEWFRLDHAAWCQYWLGTARANEAWDSFRNVLRREHYSFDSDAVYELILELRGPASAYEILVGAMSWTDWSEYSNDKREATLARVTENHPERLQDFLFDVLTVELERIGRFRPHPVSMGGVFVRHLLATDREADAKALTLRMVDIARALTAAWRFPQPGWLKA